MNIITEGKALRIKLWSAWAKLDPKIKEKFSNINGKTGKYGVPDCLFQKRTSRCNRILLPWRTILQNQLTLEQLNTFNGGVCVEFVNDDVVNEEYKKLDLYNTLIKKVGSNEKISALISFRTVDGDSGATIARNSYNKFKGDLNDESFNRLYPKIKRNEKVPYSGKGDNSVWKGKIFISIKGGSQNSIESHNKNESELLFNPAIEYANENVCLDIDITLSYFALHCKDLDKAVIDNYKNLKKEIELYLEKRNYDEGNLLSYSLNHPTLKHGKGYLVDAIQLNPILIEDFKTTQKEDSTVISHNEAANKEKFYYDKLNKCILTPARPTNLFWAKHLSNMMQQNYNLSEYFEMEKIRYEKRKKLLNN